jgi:hypothetical protein
MALFKSTWQAVSSSNLSEVRYFDGNLHIRFIGGREYTYFGVPLDVFVDLMNASSKGKYHAQLIKDVYPYKRVA